MNKIVAAIDFSDASGNASNFAAALAGAMKAKLILVHAFFIPPPPPHHADLVIDMSDDVASSRAMLASEKERISRTYDIKVETFFSTKPLLAQLSAIVKTNNVGLVVVGIRGSNAFSKRRLGSTVISLFRSLEFPVLVVPEQVIYRYIASILFAYDATAINKQNRLHALLWLAKLLKASVHVVHVKTKKGSKEAVVRLSRIMKKIQYSLMNIEDDCVFAGLTTGIAKLNPDLLVTVPGYHNIWLGEEQQSNTRKLLFRTNVSLLVLPN